jgi:16S rRNA (adenine1518-N6/adenine1519-N6)-dimethyltransferase
MIRAKKSLGQHFLSDAKIIRRIVQAVSPVTSDVIIEIGPGTGAITRPLAVQAGYVRAIEADSRMIARLNSDDKPANLSIVGGDALTIDWDDLIDSTIEDWRRMVGESSATPRVRVVGNLPYYISTPILQVLIARRKRIFDVTAMLQDEVVNRIASPPGSREYGYLSVLVQFYCNVQKLFEVPPSAFKPAPAVRSAVVRLIVLEQAAVVVDSEERYFGVVRAAFAQRRKTILNSLKAAASVLRATGPIEDAIKRAGIDTRRRAETLSIQDFASLYYALYCCGQCD